MPIDWSHWRNIASATLADFAALLAGLDPDQALTRRRRRDGGLGQQELVELRTESIDPAAVPEIKRQFEKMIKKATAAIHAEKLRYIQFFDEKVPGQTRVATREFVRWAKLNDEVVPFQLLEIDMDTEVNWAHWNRVASLKVLEGALLIAGVPPRNVALEKTVNVLGDHERTLRSYRRAELISDAQAKLIESVLDWAARAIKAGELKPLNSDWEAYRERVDVLAMVDVRRADFLSWAAAQQLELPAELEVEAAADEEPKGKRRKAMNKLLVAMAMKHYGFTPKIKNDAAATLSSVLGDMGQPISDDTIRNILKDACESLGAVSPHSRRAPSTAAPSRRPVGPTAAARAGCCSPT